MNLTENWRVCVHLKHPTLVCVLPFNQQVTKLQPSTDDRIHFFSQVQVYTFFRLTQHHWYNNIYFVTVHVMTHTYTLKYIIPWKLGFYQWPDDPAKCHLNKLFGLFSWVENCCRWLSTHVHYTATKGQCVTLFSNNREHDSISHTVTVIYFSIINTRPLSVPVYSPTAIEICAYLLKSAHYHAWHAW